MLRRAVLSCLLIVLLLPAAPIEAKPSLDSKTKKRIQDLATRWFKARPKTHFEKWDRKVRAELLKEAEAIGPIAEGSMRLYVDLLWKSVKKHGPKGKGRMDTPYGEATWIQNGSGGPKSGLILGLHGGGPGAGSAGEATKWTLPRTLGMYPQGIVLIHDTWNSVHGERFLLTLIEIAKAQYGIDPDRVYSMGFSMGGTGSMFMAGRHPDLLAGAIPAHGVVPAKDGVKKTLAELGPLEHGQIPNLRNLAVYFYTGSEDKNCEPAAFQRSWIHIEKLRKDDPGGYGLIRFRCHEGIAHSFPPGEPGKGYDFIKDKRRDAFPKKIVWEYNDDPWPFPTSEDEGKATRRWKQWMYWLHTQEPRDRMWITASRGDYGNDHVVELTVSKNVFPEDFTIYLNDRMYDVKKDVVLKVRGKEVWRGRPEPDFATVLVSLDARLDRTMVFDRRVRVPESD